jgi:hypothetical protein
MSKFAIRILMLTAGAAALAAVPIAAPAQASTSSSKHLKKHKRMIDTRQGLANRSAALPVWPNNQAWQNNQSWPNNRPYTQTSRTCFRAIDCATWPPPIDEDPDRRVIGRGH